MKRAAEARNKPTSQLIIWRNSLGFFLRKARERSRLPVRGLAELTGVSHSEITKLEAGKQDCKLDTFIRLFSFLGVPPGHVIDSIASTSFAYFGQRVERDPAFVELCQRLRFHDKMRAHLVAMLLGSLAATAVHLIRCSSPVRAADRFVYPDVQRKKAFLLFAAKCADMGPPERMSTATDFTRQPVKALDDWKLLDVSTLKDFYQTPGTLWMPLVPGDEP